MRPALRTGLGLVAATVGAWALLAGGCSSTRTPGTGGANTTTTTSGATTTTTPGTGGGCMACFATPDCPPAAACMRSTCEDHCCGTVALPAEQGCNSSGGYFCDGSGHCVGCLSQGDCAPTGTVCTAVACSSNACVVTHAAPGAPCSENGGHACDGKGRCADCAAPADCPATGTTCAAPTCGAENLCGVTTTARGASCSDHGGSVCDGGGRCVPATCLNGAKDGTETDVDCGGVCSPCFAGQGCSAASDCAEKVCGTGTPRVCLDPSCSDGVQNGFETDVDCGGICPPCADTRHCVVNIDCASGHCFGYHPGTCVSCADGVQDGNETDVDCGGADCDPMGKRCAAGEACAVGSDCTSGYCHAGACALKPDGTSCGQSSECANAHCVLDTCCHVACPTAAPSSCGNDGLCAAGGAACEMYAAGVSCATCDGGMLAQGTCDGAGSCGAGAAAPCPGHFACQSASACATSCVSDANCASGYHCATATGVCQ